MGTGDWSVKVQKVTDQWSRAIGQTIYFRGHWSGVAGQSQGSLDPDP